MSWTSEELVNSWWGKEVFLFSYLSRLALEWVLEAFPVGTTCLGHEPNPSPPSSVENEWSCTSLPICLVCMGMSLPVSCFLLSFSILTAICTENSTKCSFKCLCKSILSQKTSIYVQLPNTSKNYSRASTYYRLRWSRGSVLAFSTQVRGFKPGRSRRIFRVKKSSARLPL